LPASSSGCTFSLKELLTMRFILIMIPKGYEKAGPGAMPDAKAVAEMAKFNKAMQDAGILLSLDGLHPPARGARVTFSKGKAARRDGPFPETREAVGGYWMIRVKSREEAISWASRCPAQDGDVIEVRQVQEMEDFPEDVRKAAG
jgi:hypothetical protein